MIVYGYGKEYSGKVKFISYDGKYPNLCSGTLKLEIDGEIVIFDTYSDRFWSTGGYTNWCDGTIDTDEWAILQDKLPEKYKKYVDEIDKVFNENVEFGCCGGCL